MSQFLNTSKKNTFLPPKRVSNQNGTRVLVGSGMCARRVPLLPTPPFHHKNNCKLVTILNITGQETASLPPFLTVHVLGNYKMGGWWGTVLIFSKISPIFEIWLCLCADCKENCLTLPTTVELTTLTNLNAAISCT
jgi:hypothetical protein